MNRGELARIARAMVAKNKGILAADESSSTIKKRFDGIKLESTEEHRRTYREMLFTAPGAAEYISGVILYDETIRQKTKDGTPFPEYLTKHGIIPGIKVDTGAKPLARFPGETITEGLDGLRERLIEYYKLGARFAKWRAVIDIGDGIPTAFAIEANAQALARYAALCQEQDIVPIVEPEVLMDGAHSHRALRGSHRDACCRRYSISFSSTASILKAWCSSPTWSSRARRRRNRAAPEQVAAGDRALPQAPCAAGRARHRLPLRRPVARGGDPAPVADEQAGSAALAADFQLRPRAAGCWRSRPGAARRPTSAPARRSWRKRAKLNGLATTGGYSRRMESQAA